MKISVSLLLFLFIAVATVPLAADPADDETGTPQPLFTEEKLEVFSRLESLGFHVFKDQRLKYQDFTLDYSYGGRGSLSDYQGKVYLLNFWATWCGPCRSEIPAMEDLYKTNKDKGFTIVAVNLQESVEDVKKLQKKISFSFPVMMDTTGEVGAVYGAQAIPTTYLFDREGYVVAGIAGVYEWNSESFQEILTLLLNEQAPELPRAE